MILTHAIYKSEMKCKFKIKMSIGQVTAGHPYTLNLDNMNTTALPPYRAKTVYIIVPFLAQADQKRMKHLSRAATLSNIHRFKH
jgi:hypothetical protein